MVICAGAGEGQRGARAEKLIYSAVGRLCWVPLSYRGSQGILQCLSITINRVGYCVHICMREVRSMVPYEQYVFCLLAVSLV